MTDTKRTETPSAPQWTTEQSSLIRKMTMAATEVKGILEAGRLARDAPEHVDAFRARYQVLEKYFAKFEDYTDQLHDMNASVKQLNASLTEDGARGGTGTVPKPYAEFPDGKQANLLSNIRRFYFECMEIHTALCKPPPQAASLPQFQNVTMSDPNAFSSSSLPKISIPKFGGNYEDWIRFRDTFTSMVHDTNLTNTQKFHHLVSALTGPAKSVISSFSISDANYPIAFKALKEAYENKRILATLHLNKLLQAKPAPGKPSAESLRDFLAQVSDTIAAFKLLGLQDPAEFMLYYLATRGLDATTRENFEFKLKREEFPTVAQLTEFVRERQLALQLTDTAPKSSHQPSAENKGSGKGNSKPNRGQPSRTSLLTNSSQPKADDSVDAPNSKSKEPASSCFVCNERHGLLSCSQFHHMSPYQRREALKSFQGCMCCLSSKHTTSKCSSKHVCRLCKSKHNTLLCTKSSTTSANPDSAPADKSGATLNSHQLEPSDSQVVLGTAWVQVKDVRGQLQKVRIVLDSASQFSYITHRCLLRLGLKLHKSPRKISCLGGMLFSEAKGVSSIDIHSPVEPSTFLNTQAVVVKTITSYLPTIPIPNHIRQKYSCYNLADSRFYQPAPIDLLVGADIFPCVVDGSIQSVGDNLPKLLGTIFGYVVIGKCGSTQADSPSTSLFALQQIQDGETFDLRQFWEMEDLPAQTNSIAPQEDEAEKLFRTQHYRLPDGRFGVRLPFKSDVPDLSASINAARRRFYNLESKFKRNPELKAQYIDFMSQYESLGHMVPTSTPSKYVIPHHGVFNKSKLRVVFDGSCTTPFGSLNDHLAVGQPLQNDIRDILLRFRAHQFAFVADMVKMYRQIEVSPVDRAYQHILWRSEPSQALQTYELNTVTYGLSCSPFLALRCVKALRIEHEAQFPLAAQALANHLYVDDVVTGASSLHEALELQKQLITVLNKGGFPLAKWASNTPAILEAIPGAEKTQTPIDLSSDESPSLKVLGLKWNPTSDTFSYQIEKPDIIPTKRGILSTVSRIFDPLGFLAPTTISVKILIQKLWLAGVGWDENAPEGISKVWRDLISQLDLLSKVQIDRWVVVGSSYSFQLVAFSDSSEAAYGVAVYLRVIHQNSIQVKLLTAKTKVAPTKRLTIPRLELCGALLLARLMKSLHPFTESLEGEMLPPVHFTDSSIVLAWIRLPPTKLKIFVSNRVAEIQSLTSVDSWRHVAGQDNPSDIASRGIPPEALINHPLWWTGPAWLSEPEEAWPRSKVEYPKNPPETTEKKAKATSCLLSCSALPQLIEWMARFSSYRRLIRVTALILRFIYNHRHPKAKRTGAYLLVEISQAFTTCVKLVQCYHFFKGDTTNLPRVEEQYRSLTPFLDGKGVLRVGGRLRHADVPNDQRHQILLPHDSHFSKLLLDFYHQAHFHPGPSLLQALVQTRIWIPSLRRLVRQRTRKCLKCFKLRADAVIPRMGDLPAYRLKQGRCFDHVGVDFAGPFTMKESNRRKAPTSKVYLSLFICMTTKALHLEAVTSLSTEAFLAAFSRFMSRRGKPSHVYSDNGTNFVGASKELKALETWYREERTQNQILDFSATHQLEWHFNPPYSPHFGGLWEAGVKSVKRHLYLVAGDTPLTYEEISTIFCQVEALLNSRPLCPLSDDPNEANYLSPGHFLIGQPLVANSEPTLLDTKLNLLSRWQLLRRFSEDIWSRWRIEYLSTLQKRTKWHRDPALGLQIGDLVLIKLKDAPPFHWPTAKILDVHPGPDSQVRVVTLKTPHGVYKRTAANLVPLLPIQSDGFTTEGDQPVI